MRVADVTYIFWGSTNTGGTRRTAKRADETVCSCACDGEVYGAANMWVTSGQDVVY